MFESLIECGKNKQNGKKWVYFVVTSIIWTLALAGSVITGIFLCDARLDEQLSLITMIEPLPPPPPPLGYSNHTAAKSNQPSTIEIIPANISVRNVPNQIELPATLARANFSGDGAIGLDGFIEGDSDGVIDGVLGGKKGGIPGSADLTASAPPPPPPANDPPVEQPPRTIVRSEGVIRGSAVVRRIPNYPMTARTANVQGDVQVEITIGEDGNVVEARVISGHPLLRQPALVAARQWKFNSTLLNKTPVKVQGILTFHFTL